MKICLLFPGKIKPKSLTDAQKEYIQRLRTWGIDVVEYRDERIHQKSPDLTKKAEAERILKYLKEGDYLIACDERGSQIDTLQFSEKLRKARNREHPFESKSRIVIVIGGALGLDNSIRSRANMVVQLSTLVMAGGVARIVLLEAVYRAFTIIDGHPYHNS